MSNRLNREHEKKYRVIEGSESFLDILFKTFKASEIREVRRCSTTDWYWKTPGAAQFVRVRESNGMSSTEGKCSLFEVTSKSKDTESNLNRLELNVEIKKPKTAIKLITAILGTHPKKLVKHREHIIFLNNGTVLGFSVINHRDLIFEVECPSRKLLLSYIKKIEEDFDGKLRAEPRSLYELYIK